ncbi:hypothetical protein FHP25_25030 [Vineibacter terrae]|uniref:Uncharacterized protein n=1 Tax=Vineibacter terrae TaxID=2586908 RepID=A0A5C8PFK6_9HYPH|nr:hypothetical protein [Vineibacter terrae]TXL72563.1 hypothetical protein FHP25_25030 [Vineibacter terrae]
MARALFLSPRSIGEATLTASSEAFPVGNLKLAAQPSKVWRSATSNPWVVIDMGAAVAVDTLAMVGVTFGGGDFWQLRGASSQANLTAAPGYDSTSVSVWPVTGKPADAGWLQHTCLLRLPSVQTFRWWRIDFAGTLVQAGVLLLDKAITPSVNFSRGWELGDEPADRVVPTPYGRTLVEPRDNPRVKSLPWNLLTEADAMAAGGMGDLLRERGTAKPFLLCLDPEATTYLHQYTIYGLRVGQRRLASPFRRRHSTTLQIRELL